MVISEFIDDVRLMVKRMNYLKRRIKVREEKLHQDKSELDNLQQEYQNKVVKIGLDKIIFKGDK